MRPDDASSVALRNCLGVAHGLHKEVEDFRREQYVVWEERVGEQLSDMAAWKTSKLMTFDAQVGWGVGGGRGGR